MKRTAKRILSTLLIAIMLIGIAPVGGVDFAPEASAKDISSYSVGDIITYGSYPQSRLTDSATVSKLDGVTKDWISYGYYSGTGSYDDGNMKPSDYMEYTDFTYDGNKYRAVKINQYRPYRTGYTSSKTYQSLNGYYTGNVYYFKYEPLTWRVLDPSEGYVICNQIIDSQAYQNFIYGNGSFWYNSKDCKNYASDWKTSSLRKWLNDDFYNTAFTIEEREQIGISHIENNSTYLSKYNSVDTFDKIFSISFYDAINSAYGFNSDKTAYDTARQLKGTDYAKCQGLRVSSSYSGTSWWWLRLPTTSAEVAGASDEGGVYAGYCASYTDEGVVPAFKFNPKSTICDVHDYKAVVTEPTCTEQGYTTYTCTKCKDSYVDNYTNALGHDFGEWKITTAPTTISDGVKTRYCKNCDAFETESVGKLKSISVKLNNIETNYKKSGQLEPKITNLDNVGYKVEYKSSAPKCVIVDADGNYFAVKTGSARIICTVTDEYGKVTTAECKVNVKYSTIQWVIMIVLFGWIWY